MTGELLFKKKTYITNTDTGSSGIYIQWTESRKTSDESKYEHRIFVKGQYFEKFTTWLKQHVPDVMIKTEKIDD